MYSWISVLIGCIIAGMVAVNGGLSARYGVFRAAVIIHIVGTVFALAAIAVRREKLRLHRAIPPLLFAGGVIGVTTTVCNNFAFGKISMTSIIALGLFAQTLTSVCIDGFGLLGMEKHRLSVSRGIGLAFAAVGIGIMLRGTNPAALAAIALSLLSGVSVVLSRTVNAGLSAHIGALQGSFVNHLVGLPVTVAVFLAFGTGEPAASTPLTAADAWIFFGGVLGVVVVLLLNLTVPKLQSVNLTLLTFVGQVFTGVALDAWTGRSGAAATFYGGLVVALGLLAGLLAEYVQKRQPQS